MEISPTQSYPILQDGRHLPVLQQARGNVTFDTQMHPRKKTLPVRSVTKSSVRILLPEREGEGEGKEKKGEGMG